MNETLRVLEERRSIKKYKSEQVEEEKLQAILRAGTYAASGKNRQPSIMIVVQNPEDREILRRMNATLLGNPGADPFYGAPTVVVVLAERGINTHVEDGSLVMGNLMNAAYSVGVDSCWVHRAKEEFDSEEGKALLQKWGIEGDYEGIGHCLLGYRDCEMPVARQRKENYIYRV